MIFNHIEPLIGQAGGFVEHIIMDYHFQVK